MELEWVKAHKVIRWLLSLALASSQSSLTSVWTNLESCKSLFLVNVDSSVVALIFDEMCGEFKFSSTRLIREHGSTI